MLSLSLSLSLSRSCRGVASVLPLAAFCLAVLTTGCADELATNPYAETGEDATVLPSEATADERQDAIDELARSIALALAEPQARAAIIREMRGSRFHEHKLLLSSFMASDVGATIMNIAYARGGASSSQIAAYLGRFPDDLDFYVASIDQRRSWAGSGRILVAGVISDDATEARAYDPEGKSLIISSLDVPGYDVVFSLHPAEAKVVVDDVRDRGNRVSTIESESKFDETGGTADAICELPCEVEPGPGGGGPGGGGGGGGGEVTETFTMVNRILPQFDDCFLCGDLELFFVVANVSNSADTTTTPIFKAVPRQLNIVNVHLHDESANSGSGSLVLRAKLFEDDNNIINDGDDYKGESLPNIAGQGGYDSWDPFLQTSWGTYNIVVGCIGETWCQ